MHNYHSRGSSKKRLGEVWRQVTMVISGSICIVERWKKSIGYRFTPECNHAQERPSFLCHICRGARARENRGRERYGRREEKGRKAGSLRWWEAGEKFRKASFRYLLLFTASQRNEPNNVSWLPFNVLRGLKQNFISQKSQKTKGRTRDNNNKNKNKNKKKQLETFPSRLHHRTWMRWHMTHVHAVRVSTVSVEPVSRLSR